MDCIYLGQVLAVVLYQQPGRPWAARAERCGRIWLHRMGSGPLPGSRDTVLTTASLLLIQTKPMILSPAHSPGSRGLLPSHSELRPPLSLLAAAGPLPVLCALPGPLLVQPAPTPPLGKPSQPSPLSRVPTAPPLVSTFGFAGSAPW